MTLTERFTRVRQLLEEIALELATIETEIATVIQPAEPPAPAP